MLSERKMHEFCSLTVDSDINYISLLYVFTEKQRSKNFTKYNL